MHRDSICLVCHALVLQLGQIVKLVDLTLRVSAAANLTAAQLHHGFLLRCFVPHEMLHPVPFSSV